MRRDRPVLDAAALAHAERLRAQGLTWPIVAARIGCTVNALLNARKARREAAAAPQERPPWPDSPAPTAEP